MKDFLFTFIFVAYIFNGVFIVLWMDRNYFDVKSAGKASEKGIVWRVLFWPFILPFVWPKIIRIKKQRAAQAQADFEAMMERWKAMPEKPKEIVVEGNVLVHGIAGEVIPNTVKEIGEQAFCCCEELEEIVIPDTVTKIGVGAFDACQNLSKVVIPESVTEIGDCAFYECCNLAELHLPASLKKLGDAFDGSYYDGMELYCHMPEPIPYALESDEGYPPNTNDRLFVPKGAKAKYEAAEPWNYYETIKEMK